MKLICKDYYKYLKFKNILVLIENGFLSNYFDLYKVICDSATPKSILQRLLYNNGIDFSLRYCAKSYLEKRI